MIFNKDSFIRDKNNRWLVGAALASISAGTVFYHLVEGWMWIDSLYFSVITLTTVGYGDFSPKTDAGKIYTCFYVIFGIGIVFGFINNAFEHRASKHKARQERNSNS